MSTERFTALIDANAQSDPDYIWIPLEIEDYLVQPGLVGVNVLQENYKFADDLRERIMKNYPGLTSDDMCIIFIQKGNPSILDIADVEIGYEDGDINWIK